MKAILVIDMPENCCDCPFYDNDCPFVYIYPLSGRHKDCPLRYLPQKNKYDVEKYATVDYENNITLGNYLNEGWNACLDEIMGETE